MKAIGGKSSNKEDLYFRMFNEHTFDKIICKISNLQFEEIV